jgi:hypothetical protein
MRTHSWLARLVESQLPIRERIDSDGVKRREMSVQGWWFDVIGVDVIDVDKYRFL